MNSDNGLGFFSYESRYVAAGGYTWNEGNWSNSGRVPTNGTNINLGYEKRRDINFGFESVLFDHKLSIDANLFSSVYYDQVTQTTTQYPSFYTYFIPYENFNSNSYKGAELGLSYKEELGDFTVVIGRQRIVCNF